MRHPGLRLVGLIACLAASLAAASQELPGNADLKKLQSSYQEVGNDLDRQSLKVLENLREKENRFQKKLAGRDSTGAKTCLTQAESAYDRLAARLKSPSANASLKEYIPGLDSMQTAVGFLLSNGSAFPAGKLAQLQGLSSQLQQLEGKIQGANEVQDFVRQREQVLKAQLGRYGFEKELTSVNRQVYYYQQRLQQYKTALNDREKAKELLLSGVSRLPGFQRYMQKYGMLARLCPAPADAASTKTLAGLQTSDQVRQQISHLTGVQTDGGNKGNAGQYLEQQAQAAQGELDKLKGKLNQLGASSGSTNMTMPDFQPDGQKAKKFLQRLEFGWNLQSQGSSHVLPAATDFGLSLGYRLSDKASLGIGGSYRLGWGSSINHIQLSNEGLGLRSYVDIKAKGSIWISGGMEYNYFQAFQSLRQLDPRIAAWKGSALLGLTKKYNIGRKKEGRMQLLYDFLADRQIPRTQPLQFRVGCSL
ncbi:hypothetical protein [Puia dinghuensis]|uniref:Uncharacterized protein n=1 Tax=Puia dinghuensis TaxID=1792502 RepID=A0A8J2UHI5_9BACT|nr:hypothetical protein [Puia dinghuensis]GGB17633.1 hypothetical protein GCM10011511_46800 [Puia dinghuensis]